MVAAPSQSLAIIGHEAAKKQLEAAYGSGRMHHAWLFLGQEGIGKASLAYHVAHMILSGGANTLNRFNPEHDIARLIMADSHPDLFLLRRVADEKTGVMKENISVDQARKLGPFLQMTASHGHGRVALIDEAHALGRGGQNAILKMIEEPPTGAVILLTATTAGSLLPTIRSRCRIVPMMPLSAGEMDVIFARLGVELPSGAAKTRLLALAQGSVGLALRILEADVLPLYDEMLALLAAMPALDMGRLHKLADQIGKKADAERFDVLSTLLSETLREAARAMATGQADAAGLAVRLAGRGRLDNALELWEKTRATFAVADGANLDPKLAFITAMTAIARAMA